MTAVKPARKAHEFRARVIEFFTERPDEEIWTADAVTKFGVSSKLASARLSRMAEEQLVAKRVEGPPDNRLAVWSAGPALFEPRNWGHRSE